jgi:hypothetical protein
MTTVKAELILNFFDKHHWSRFQKQFNLAHIIYFTGQTTEFFLAFGGLLENFVRYSTLA